MFTRRKPVASEQAPVAQLGSGSGFKPRHGAGSNPARRTPTPPRM